MKNNQLQLVNFEQAQRLKKAGFDWPTMHCYYMDGSRCVGLSASNHNEENLFFSTPTVALALKWMRDMKGIYGAITRDESGWYFTIHNREGDTVKFFDNETWPTYEAAESALLDELQTIIDNQ